MPETTETTLSEAEQKAAEQKAASDERIKKAELEQASRQKAADEAAKAAAKRPKKTVRVQAVFNKMRNPYTGAIFTKANPTDVADLNSLENCWTRSQLKAKVLEIVD